MIDTNYIIKKYYLDTLSINELFDLQNYINDVIKEKIKNDALNKSGEYNGKDIFDTQELKLVTDKLEYSFVKWFAKEKVFKNIEIPKHLFRVDRDNLGDFEVYIFANEENNLCIPSGRHLGIQIHKDAKPYLLEEFASQFDY